MLLKLSNKRICQDFEAWCIWKRRKKNYSSFLSFLNKPENRIIIHMRLCREGIIGKIIGRFLLIRTRHLNLYIAPEKIEGGFTVMHGFSTVINPQYVGENFHVAQQVTIGWGPTGLPTIGKNVKVYAGAIIVGGVTIGDNAIIGAGTVVTKDVPADTLVVGAPNRIIKILNNEDKSKSNSNVLASISSVQGKR